MTQLFTTLGSRSRDGLGLILPHEHIFVDLGAPDRPDFGQAKAEAVVALMGPEVERARAAGVTALVECTPVGVGRRVDLVCAVSRATNFPIAVATGIYREPWVPRWAHDAGEDELRDWMMRELNEGIEGANVRAAFIKLSAGDDGLTDVEQKILRAAARAAKHTGAAIGSHTIRGRVVRDQLDILEASGYTASRFIWIHASAEPDFSLNLEMARRGAWIEYDWIGGSQPDAFFIERICRLLDAGYSGQILLSQDRGWFDPSQPNGGTPKPFTYLTHTFLPALRDAGVDEETIRLLTQDNPFRAFSR
ncbi:MAG: esterase [Anaerolineae bacterium]|nr:esterase [Anaerolineae bacterium]